jgi:predicted Na+-dependent transporter
MSFKDFIKFSLKLIMVVYVCAILIFILLNVGSHNENYLTDAFSPVKLFEEIISGNFLFIMCTTIATVFIFRFNYYRREKEDY